MDLIIHTDGGSLHNPGPSACAFVIHSGNTLIKESSFFLGNQTNNIAEYMGVIYALQEVINISKQSRVHSCVLVSDSLLLVNQINGIYKVKQEHLKTLHERVTSLIKNSGVPIVFKHTLREGNAQADGLVKKELLSYS